jgi:hypothetical protein
MPLDPFLVEAAVRSGLSAVCATCRRYWEGRERGLPEPRCTAQSGCGSPLAGGDFHEYDGPITEFDRWCFVCSGDSKYGVRAKGKKRLFGVCEEHVRLLHDLKPVDAQVSAPILKTASGEELRPAPVVPQKSLAAAIAAAEKEFAAKGRGR